MGSIKVHPRVHERHPDISDEDVLVAWGRLICRTRRVGAYDDNFVAVGFDSSARLLELVAIQTGEDDRFVFHAMPASEKALAELGLI